MGCKIRYLLLALIGLDGSMAIEADLRPKVAEAPMASITIGTEFKTLYGAAPQTFDLTIPTALPALFQVVGLSCNVTVNYNFVGIDPAPILSGRSSFYSNNQALPGCGTVDAFGVLETGAGSNNGQYIPAGRYSLAMFPSFAVENTADPTYAVRVITTNLAASGTFSPSPLTTVDATSVYTLTSGTWSYFLVTQQVILSVDHTGGPFNLTWTWLSCFDGGLRLFEIGYQSQTFGGAAQLVDPAPACNSYASPEDGFHGGGFLNQQFALPASSYQLTMSNLFGVSTFTMGFSFGAASTSVTEFSVSSTQTATTESSATSTENSSTETTLSIHTSSMGDLTIILDPVDRNTARAYCNLLGLKLAAINTPNWQNATDLVANLRPAWVDSWNGNCYQGTCLAMYPGGTISMYQQPPCFGRLSAICGEPDASPCLNP